MFDLNVRGDVKSLAKSFGFFAKGQMPFATATAINKVAEVVRDAERANLEKVLDKPTPFTKNAIKIKKANKATLHAVVYMQDKTASYLAPYEFGGLNKLNSEALLKPVGAVVNQYGNLPRNAMKRLLGKSNVFVGKVQFKKSGQTINGVWERPARGQRSFVRGKDRHSYGSKGNTQNMIGGGRTGLKLLIKFEDAHEARQRLNYRQLARRKVDGAFKREFMQAMRDALRSAR